MPNKEPRRRCRRGREVDSSEVLRHHCFFSARGLDFGGEKTEVTAPKLHVAQSYRHHWSAFRLNDKVPPDK